MWYNISMKTIIEILDSKRTDAWFGKTFPRLKLNQLKFIEEYLKENKDIEFNEFHKKLNRLFIITQVETLSGIEYFYDDVFPKNKKGNHPMVSTAQELMGAVFNEYRKQQGN